MFHDFTQEELRSACRQNIESLEIWARRIIHEELCHNYGADYFNYQFGNGEYLVKNDIREKAKHIRKNDKNLDVLTEKQAKSGKIAGSNLTSSNK